MAAAAIADIPEELRCPICFEEFTKPKVLDCKHVFCCKCLEKWMKEKTKLTCPVCKNEGSLKRGEKIEDLPEPLYFTKLNEASTRFMTASLTVTEDRMCDACKQVKAARYFCYNCGRNMCEQCEQKHSAKEPYQNHKVIQLSKHTVCSEHKGELKTLYCQDCQIGICTMCFEVTHERHSVTDAQETIPGKAEKLQIFKKTTEQIRKYVVQYELDLKTEESCLLDKYRSAERELEDVRKKLNDVIDEIKGEVQQKLRAEKKKLLFHKRDVQDTKVTQENLLKYIDHILNKGSDMDIVSAADNIPSMWNNVSLVLPKLDIPSVRGDEVIELCKSLVQYGAAETVGSHLIGSKKDKAAVGGRIRLLSEVATGSSPGSKLWQRKIDSVSVDTLYDEKTGDIWINTDCKSVGLVRYNLQGDFLSGVVKGTSVYYFSLDTNRDTFIANIGPDSIASISNSGDIIRQVTTLRAGTLEGMVYLPDRDCLAVCDWKKHCVWFIEAERMNVVNRIGSQGSRDNQFDGPLYLGYHSGAGYPSPVIVVGDCNNHCVKVLDTQGMYIRKYGSCGSGDRKLNGPRGVCVDNKGRILICDCYNRRVVRFWDAGDREQWEVVVTPDQLGGLYPVGMCVTNKGHLAVTTVTAKDGKPVPPSYLSLFSYQ